MTDHRDQRLGRLLLAGLDVPADRRRATLEHLEEDASLIEEALRLIEAEDDAFLAESPVRRLGDLEEDARSSRDRSDTVVEHDPTSVENHRASSRSPASGKTSEDLPDRVGPFRILDRLGQGGMGIVYLAEQTEPVRRRVALKMLRQGFGDRELRARFEAERHAVARLHHPNVAQLYEAGSTDDGQPWFAMELVEGQPLTSYCDAQKLDIRARIELFRSVCDGVQHAHQKGLLHRDLKPANILVATQAERPVPKVLDFGIAKAIDRPLVEGTLWTGEQLIGTPAYLSPEAIDSAGIDSDLDTRADVYALGIVLYELLVGVRPFETKGRPVVETLRLVAESDPPAPSTRWTNLDPETRIGLANRRGVETGVQDRHLRGDLDWILQKAISRDRDDRYPSVEHLSADLARHLRDEPVEASPPSTLYRMRKFVRRRRGVVVAAGLVFASLTLGLTGTLVNLDRAQREAEAAREALREAEEVSEFLESLFEVSDPGEARGNEVTARELLDRGAEEILDGFEDRPLVKARFLVTLGRVFGKLGLYERARPFLEEAVAIREAEPPAPPADLATALAELGSVLLEDGSHDEAGPILQRALELRRGALGPDDSAIAQTLDHSARLAFHQGDYDRAEELYRQAVDLRTRVLGPDDRSLASSLGSLGILLWYRGRYDEAETILRRTLEIAERHLSPDHPEIGKHLNNLGGLYGNMGRFEDAEPLFRRSLEIAEKALGPDHPTLAQALNNLALIYTETGRFTEAEDRMRRALEIRERAFGAVHHEVANSQGNIASLLTSQGRFDEAEPHFRESLAIREELLGPNHPDRGKALADYGSALMDSGRREEAETRLREGYEVLAAQLEPDHPWVRSALRHLLKLLEDQGRADEAIAVLREALAGHDGEIPENLHSTARDAVQLLRKTGAEGDATALEARMGS